MSDVIVIIEWVSAALLVVAALLAVLRVAFGPSVLDRAVATDLLTSIGVAVVALIIVWWNRSDLRALLIIFAITGLFSSTTIARFLEKDKPDIEGLSEHKRRGVSPEGEEKP